MLSKSKKKPQSIKTATIGNYKSYVWLRRDIRQTEEGYEYQEVKIKLSKRKNLQQYVEANFEELFNYGLTLEKTPDNPALEQRIEALEETVALLMEV